MASSILLSELVPGEIAPARSDHASESKKRPREETSSGHKRKKSKKASHNISEVTAEDDIDHIAKINKTIGRMDSQLLADLLARKTRRYEASLETQESEGSTIPSSAITDTSRWAGIRDSTHLPDFLEDFIGPKRNPKQLYKAADAPGRPHTLVIAPAGLRAADLTRSLRKFQSESAKVAKLFAKHIKLREAIESAKKTRMNIGVGTPQRIADLLDNGTGAILLDDLQRIVIDASHVNDKNQSIFDIRETHGQLIRLLTRQAITARYAAQRQGIELLFY